MRVEDYYVTHFSIYNNENVVGQVETFITIRDPDYGETYTVPHAHEVYEILIYNGTKIYIFTFTYHQTTGAVIDANYVEVTQENIDIPDNSADYPENFNNNYLVDRRKVSTPGRAKRTFFFVFLAEASRFGMEQK